MTTATTDRVVLSRFPLPNLVSNFRNHAYRNNKEMKEINIECYGIKVVKVMASVASSLRVREDLEY
jgi:hypothetical protein